MSFLVVEKPKLDPASVKQWKSVERKIAPKGALPTNVHRATSRAEALSIIKSGDEINGAVYPRAVNRFELRKLIEVDRVLCAAAKEQGKDIIVGNPIELTTPRQVARICFAALKGLDHGLTKEQVRNWVRSKFGNAKFIAEATGKPLGFCFEASNGGVEGFAQGPFHDHPYELSLVEGGKYPTFFVANDDLDLELGSATFRQPKPDAKFYQSLPHENLLFAGTVEEVDLDTGWGRTIQGLVHAKRVIPPGREWSRAFTGYFAQE